MNCQSSQKMDWLGIMLSGACAVHCLMMPVLPFLLPTITVGFDLEWLHIALLLLIIPMALFNFTYQKKYHKKSLPLFFGFAGVAFLVSAVTTEGLLPFEVAGLEMGLTVLGSGLLIVGHSLNLYYLKKAPSNS